MYKKIGATGALASGVIGLLILIAAPQTGSQGTVGLIAFGIAAILLVQAVYGVVLVEQLRE